MNLLKFAIPGLLFLIGSCNFSNEISNNESRNVLRPFNDRWSYCTDSLKIGRELKWFNIENLPVHLKNIELPHTWNTESDLEEYYGSCWYFKEFEVPKGWSGKVVRIQFKAINRDSKIWLNGQLIKVHNGSGYTPFEIDISSHLNFNTKNFLAINVNNQFSNLAIPYWKSFDWPNDGGIIREVNLIKSDPPSIKNVHVIPVLKDDKSGKVHMKINLVPTGSESIPNIDVWIRVKEFNQPTDNIVFEGNRKARIINSSFYIDFDIEQVNPWHFNSPNLYELEVAIGHKMILTDNHQTNFGFRSITTKGSKLLFNSEPVRLPGLEWMPGSNPDQGLAESYENMDKMLSLLKGTNAVFTRFHWQQDEHILDWCDLNGILVQEEIPLWQSPKGNQVDDTIQGIAQLHAQEMIQSHFNHPSIIAWGIGNELQAQDKRVKELLNFLYREVKLLDSTRLINYVSNTLQQDPANDGTNVGDLIMWNDYSGLWYNMTENGITKEMMPALLDSFSQIIPDKPIIISEYGLCEPVFKGGDDRRIEHLKYNTSVYNQKPYIAGVIYFSLNDYRTHMGEEGEGRFKRRVHGIVDIDGKKKPSYDSLRTLFSPIKNVQVKEINGRIHVTGNNHNGLPGYSIFGYKIEILSDHEVLFDKYMPFLEPGSKFNIVVDHDLPSDFTLRIRDSRGNSILEKNIVNF